MSRELIDCTLNRGGVGKTATRLISMCGRLWCVIPKHCRNLLRVTATAPLAEILSWSKRSGCACSASTRSVQSAAIIQRRS